MARSDPLLDTGIVRDLYRPEGDWAKECGRRVRNRRTELGFTLSQLADLADANIQTIFKVERGMIVPRDYLKASIAYALALEVNDLWGPFSRLTLMERAKAVPA